MATDNSTIDDLILFQDPWVSSRHLLPKTLIFYLVILLKKPLNSLFFKRIMLIY